MLERSTYFDYQNADVSKRRTKGERTRDAMAEAAIRILRDEGYEALTIASLAEDAGLRRSSYYTHFKDLDELIDELSIKILDGIGRHTSSAEHPPENETSLLLTRLKFVLQLRRRNPTVARVLSELYVNHGETARKVHRGIVRDISADRRNGLLKATNRESEAAALFIGAGAVELLRDRHGEKLKDDRVFLKLVSRICLFVRDAAR
ncbi:MAG: TetR family transcriptional regulator [Pseudomonadota bacterium]